MINLFTVQGFGAKNDTKKITFWGVLYISDKMHLSLKPKLQSDILQNSCLFLKLNLQMHDSFS